MNTLAIGGQNDIYSAMPPAKKQKKDPTIELVEYITENIVRLTQDE